MVLENPVTINKSFSITSMVEKNALINDMDTETTQFIEVNGYASRMYQDDKYVVDADNENVNTFGFDLKRLKNGILPLLYNHQQDKPVGKVTEATYDKEGLLIKAILFKYKDDALTNFVYNSVKSGVISSFSVGMLVKDFEVVTQDGEEYLQLSESEVIEISLVSVPSNPEALFRVTNIKSVDGTEKTVTLLEKSLLKAENTEACSGFECALKQKKQKEVEMVTKNVEEEKAAVLAVADSAIDSLEKIIAKEEDTAQRQDTERAEGAVITPEPKDSEETDKSNDKPSEEPQVDLEKTPEEILSNNLHALGDIDISKLSDDELEKVYEALVPIIEQIEARVVAEVAAAMQEGMTISAPV